MSSVETNMPWESGYMLPEESGKHLSRILYLSNDVHILVTDNDFLKTHSDLIQQYLQSGSHLTLYTADFSEDLPLQGNIAREKLSRWDEIDLLSHDIRTLVIHNGGKPCLYWEKDTFYQEPTSMFETIGGWCEAIVDVGHETMELLGVNSALEFFKLDKFFKSDAQTEPKQDKKAALLSNVVTSLTNEELAIQLKGLVNKSLDRNVL